MLSTLVRRSVQQTQQTASTWDTQANKYKARHAWPPDFSKLSPKHQFRLERRYKRRAKLKWARPKFMIATKLLQWGGSISLVVYGVFFMDWEDNNAFSGARKWYRETVDSLWSTRSTQSGMRSTNTSGKAQ